MADDWTRSRSAPLSQAQRRLWFLYRLTGPGAAYNLPLAIRLSGRLDEEALDSGLQDAVRRHAALRTVVRELDGEPYQQVMPAMRACLALHKEQVAQALLTAAVSRAARHGFDLTRDPPVRASLFTLSPDDHVLLIVLHRIAADEWSLRPLVRDLATAYAARCDGREPPWGPLPPMRDDAGQNGSMSPHVEYWKSALADLPTELTLPTDQARPSVTTHRSGSVPLSLDADLHLRLLRLAKESDTTLFIVLLAGLAALLTRLGAGADIPVGTRVAGRRRGAPDGALDDLVGSFANTLVLRADTSGDPGFRELLRRVHTVHRAAHAHKDVPFEHLVDVLGPARSMARHPLFQVTLAVEDGKPDTPRFADLAARLVPVDLAATTVDLSFSLTARVAADGSPAGLSGDLVYSADLFRRDTAVLIATRLARLLTAAAADAELPVGELDILSSAERRELLVAGTGAASEVIGAGVTELFAAVAARDPDAVAVVYGDSALTYQELAARSWRLARCVRRHGVGPDALVGLCVEPGIEMIVGALGILAAGGAYVPVDPDYPAERIAFMLQDCDPALVLTVRRLRDRLPAGDWSVISLDESWDAATGGVGDLPLPVPYPASLAYAIYTSGSTGIPKGIAVTHRNVVNLISDHYWRNGNHQRVLLRSAFSFDASTYELWVPLLSGGRIVMAAESRVDASELGNEIAQHDVTVAYFTTALFEVMAQEAIAVLGQLREIWTGGDVLSPVALQRVLDECPNTTVIHEYGPTETTVFCSFQRFDEVQRQVGVQTLGSPMDNVRTYLLDSRLRLTPPGTVGDIYVAGEGVAREYLKRPALTATKFVADPFGGRGTRMYRTGDLAKWGTVGQLEFVGRADDLVKVRGFRVEPAEVEAVLARHPMVGQVAVVAREDPSGGKRLVGYVVPGVIGEADVRKLAGFAREHLPDYLVPSVFVAIDRLPLTPSGKLDRRALPSPSGPDAESGPGFVAPRTRAEKAMAQVWGESLGARQVGIHDSFFDLGGSSYQALRVISRLQALFKTEIPIRTIFRFPTIAELMSQIQTFVGNAKTKESALSRIGRCLAGTGLHRKDISCPRKRPSIRRSLTRTGTIYVLYSQRVILDFMTWTIRSTAAGSPG
jgi:amino acid adenylation domain-containing protein